LTETLNTSELLRVYATAGMDATVTLTPVELRAVAKALDAVAAYDALEKSAIAARWNIQRAEEERDSFFVRWVWFIVATTSVTLGLTSGAEVLRAFGWLA
jgi:hypothetical protein